MLEFILNLLCPPKASKPVRAVEVQPSCSKSIHLFTNTPVGKARLHHRCKCKQYTLMEYQRRWDRR